MVKRLRGLAPLAGPRSRILILGSFPGGESLRRQEYYAHERNDFWKILPLLFEPGRDLKSYHSRKRFILKHGLAVWDVIASCERATSADSRIRHPEVNDFAGFFSRHPCLERVILNGRTAEKFWHRYVLNAGLPAFYAPSTSPALASLSLKQKALAWRKALG